MPKDDDGLPKERCTLKREVSEHIFFRRSLVVGVSLDSDRDLCLLQLAKRLWWNCVFIDGIFASSEGMGLIRLGKGSLIYLSLSSAAVS